MNKNELKTIEKIKEHAYGSIYRMNAKTADCYVFFFTNNGKDWEGGWDWSNNLIDDNADYMLMLATGKIKKIIREGIKK